MLMFRRHGPTSALSFVVLFLGYLQVMGSGNSSFHSVVVGRLFGAPQQFALVLKIFFVLASVGLAGTVAIRAV